MTRRDIIDPHHHLWSLKEDRYPWLRTPMEIGVGGDLNSISQDYLNADYLADTQNYNLRGSVHIEAAFDRETTVDETEWLAGLMADHPIPFALVAYAALQNPDVESTLERHAALSDSVKGIRQILCWHDNPAFRMVERGDLLGDPAWRSGFAKLSKHGLSFDLMIYPGQLDEAAALAADFPDTSIIVNHGAMPLDRSEEGLSAWKDGLAKLAENENVSIKISGLGQTDWHWTQASMHRVIRDIIEVFSPARCMFASNFPVDKAYSSFDALYQAYEAVVADLSEDEQHAVFCGNAARIYRLN